MKNVISVISLFIGLPAFADCPAPPDISVEEARLLSEIQGVQTEMEARPVSNALWALWAKAPDEAAQALLDRGMSARSSWNFLDAIDAFDRLVEYCPDYAEGYNQRAFVNFLREDYPAALVDLDLALERHPTHVAALSGKALTLMGLGRHDEAQEVLRDALELNPWLPERGLLVKPKGEEL
jgi:tetratricopeptide (TPR) repeat protein